MKRRYLLPVAIAAIATCLALAARAEFNSGILLSGPTQSVPPPPGSIACDYGPNTTLPTGSAGTDVVAAGFTHCFLNADFTDNSGTAGGHSWVMNNPNTWLNECPGPATSTWGKFWLVWSSSYDVTNSASDGGHALCSRAQLVTDTGVSPNTQALQFQWAPSDEIDTNHWGITLMWPLCGEQCLGQRPALAQAMYEEVTWRLPLGESQNVTTIILSRDENTVFNSGPGQAGGYMDMVFLELQSNSAQSSVSMDNWGNNGNCGGHCTGGGAWVPPVSAYHAYGNLSTTDSSQFNVCMYMDNAPQFFDMGTLVNWGTANCGHYFNWDASMIADHDRRFLLGMGRNTFFATPITGNMTVLVKSVRMFTCANPTLDCTAAQSGGSIVFH